MPSTTEISPQERLAITRKAIVRHMNRDDRVNSNHDANSPNNDSGYSRNSIKNALDHARHAVLVWWDRHPASAVLELARPLMSDYAGSHPLKLLGVSALIGSAIVLIKPWRMMSVGNWFVAAAKSSGLTSGVLSLLTRSRSKF